MEHIIKQPPIIRLPHLGLVALGIILVILAPKAIANTIMPDLF